MPPIKHVFKQMDGRQRLVALTFILALGAVLSTLYIKGLWDVLLIALTFIFVLLAIAIVNEFLTRKDPNRTAPDKQHAIGRDNIGRDQTNINEIQESVLATGGHNTINVNLTPSEPATKPATESWTPEQINQYKERLKKQHATTRILGKTSPIPLEGIYTDIFVLDKLTAQQRFEREALQEQFPTRFEDQSQRERHDGLAYVSRSGNLFILGKPGAGKTTFLRYIALQEGTALLLFDGLDEVNQEHDQRRTLTQQLKDVIEQYPETQTLITCRIAASDYQFPNCQEVEVADFTQEQVKTYVNNWFDNNPEKREAFFVEFEKSENKSIRGLSTIPLLLSLLCLVFDESMGFPQRRSELYKRALNVLLEKWDASRAIRRDSIYQTLSTDLKQNMLAAIAAETFQAGNYILPQTFLIQRIEAYLANLPSNDQTGPINGRQVLTEMTAQHGILVERASDLYSFSHLTLHEYLAAHHIVANEASGLVKGLLTLEHIVEDRWEQVILLTAGLLNQADQFFHQFQKSLDRLIAPDETLINLLKWVETKATQANASYKQPAIRAFYIYNDLDRDRDRALDSARVLNLDSYRTQALNSDRALDLDLNLALNLNPDRTLDPALAFDRTKKLKLTKLHTALTRQTTPTANASQEEWTAFAEQLRQIMIEHSNIGHDWNLTLEQIQTLNNYLRANQLLLQCLEVAYVTNREAIKDRLLLPPAPQTE